MIGCADMHRIRRKIVISSLLLPLAIIVSCVRSPVEEFARTQSAIAAARAAEAPRLSSETFNQAETLLTAADSADAAGDYREAKRLLIAAASQATLALTQAQEAQLNPESALPEVNIEALDIPSPVDHAGAPTVPPQTAPSPPPPVLYNVANGETLWSIAARPNIYADALLWPLIYQANRDQIRDPRQIFPGQTLSLPRTVSDAQKEETREAARRSNIFPLNSLSAQ